MLCGSPVHSTCLVTEYEFCVCPCRIVAAHCCAVIGAVGCFVAATLWYAVFTNTANRKFVLFAMVALQPINSYIQITWPFNDPPPEPMKLEMPWPMIVLPTVTCLVALFVGEADEKSHDA